MHKDNKYVLVTDSGVVAPNIKDPSEVLAMLLYAYLNIWNEEKFDIDILEAGNKIVDLLLEMRETPKDHLFTVLDYLLNNDEENEE